MFLLILAAGGVSLGLWHQTFGLADLGIVGLLVLLEGVLSIDNALVLGLLAQAGTKAPAKASINLRPCGR
jgi:predicted tellurium resistance membrane protein TerC